MIFKKKGEKVKLLNGDCIGIIIDKVSKELTMGFEFKYEIISQWFFYM